MFMSRSSLLVPALLLLSGGAGSAGGAAAGKDAYHPAIDPAHFQAAVDNPYYPLVPGTTFKLIEKSDEGQSEDDVTVTHDTRVIMGVTCVVVHDVEKENGTISEETFDWYAQDKDGNVWCFGEDTKEFHAKGKLSTEGSWEAGIDGAQPGIVMPGRPAPGEPYREEYSPGKAEDMGQVIAATDSVTVVYGAFRNCVVVKEWSPLETGSEKKWFAKGVGLVKVLEDGETTELVSVTRPE